MTERWIPCSKRLPNPGIEVWVTFKGHDVIIQQYGETFEHAAKRVKQFRWTGSAYWDEYENEWREVKNCRKYSHSGFPLIAKPIAWMPKTAPKPWEGDCDET